jgi:hypothetical protein
MLNIDVTFRVIHRETAAEMMAQGCQKQDLIDRMAVVSYSGKSFVTKDVDYTKNATDPLTWKSKGEEKTNTFFEYVQERQRQMMKDEGCQPTYDCAIGEEV